MHKKLITLMLLAVLGFQAFAQTETEKTDFSIYYSSPQKYTIGGIEVEGVPYLDRNALISLSGLKVGQEVIIPGDVVTNAIKKLWGQQLFSDVKIEASKLVGDKIYLTIHLQSVKSLSKVNFNGVSKSEKDDIKSRVVLLDGMKITPAQLSNAEKIIKDIFHGKGYFNTEVSIVQRDDKAKENSIILDINVDKKEKVKIKEVTFHGNSKLTARMLERAMKKTKAKKFRNFFHSKKFLQDKYDEDKINLIKKYNEKGFRDAIVTADSISKNPDNTVNVDIWLEEGNKYFFRDIKWVGNTQYDSQILGQVLGIKKGDIYDQKLLNKRLFEDEGDAVSALYQDNGYVFFNLDPVETKIENDSIDLEMRIYEGRQATIDKVIITGNTKTHEHVARRELRTLPGDLFSKDKLMRSYRELAQLGHFDPEKIKPDVIPNAEDGTVNIKYELAEKANDQIELSGGWGGNMIIGSVGLKFSNFSVRNIFNKEAWRPLPTGDGQTLSLRAQTNGKYYQSYSLNFMEPWLGGKKPNSLSVSVFHQKITSGQRQYNYNTPYSYGGSYGGSYGYNNYGYSNPYDYKIDRAMITTGVSLGYGYRLKWPDDFFTVYHQVQYQHNYLDNWTYYQRLLSDGNTNTLSFKTAISRNSIDNPLYSRHGSSFTLSAELTPPFSLWDGVDYDDPKLSQQDRYRWIEFHKWKFSGDVYTPLDKQRKFVLHTKFESGFLGYYNKKKKSPLEGFNMGGDGMSGYSYYNYEIIGLRGYGNNSVTPASGAASLYNKLTMELRYPIALKQSATIYAMAFLEAGNAWEGFGQYNPFDLKRSAGIGLRIFLPMFGLMGIDWGYGFDNVPNGENKGQFHFVIGQKF
ncbi:outer membrane protein assembly factor BamA [Prolixibacteraceae bacterium JC049]|nr:outer membrane protein assembly factor BamA [Prolixibacteraceae bacterium JC049]